MYKIICYLIYFILISSKGYSQVGSNYERGYKEGVKNGYCLDRSIYGTCSYPMIIYPPRPKIHEDYDSYQDGYNRGFQHGQDLFKFRYNLTIDDNNLKQEIISFNNYISQNPVNAMVAVGMRKQAMYDAGKNWIQGRIDSLKYLMQFLTSPENLPPNVDAATLRAEMWNPVVRYSKQIAASDFSDTYVFRSIQSKFDQFERDFYVKYNNKIMN
jgi:hypothetical protein